MEVEERANEHRLSDIKESSPEAKGVPNEIKDSAPEAKGVSDDIKESAPEAKGVPNDIKDSAPKAKGVSDDIKDSAPEAKGVPNDFDDILTDVGQYGPYQKWRLLAIIILPSSFLLGTVLTQTLFQVVVPDHWCHVPGRPETMSRQEWQNLTIPRSRETDELSKCYMYKRDPTEGDDIHLQFMNETEDCKYGWEHDTTQLRETVATTHQWFCDKERYSNDIMAVNMAGNAVGTSIFPFLADKYFGRRLVFFATLVVYLVFATPLPWVSNYPLHLALRFLAALSFESNYLLPFIVVLELIPPDKRALTTMLAWTAWTSGLCFSSLLAWLVPNWRHLVLFSLIPSALGFLYWRILPESPRWLLSKGRVKECAEILLQVAQKNGIAGVSENELENDLIHLSKQQQAEVDVPFTKILQYPKLRLRMLLLLLTGACVLMVYGVLVMGINVMSSNYFLSNFFLSVVEFPSNVSGWLLANYLGRRFTAACSFLIASVFCFIATFCVHNEWAILMVVCATRLFWIQGMLAFSLMMDEIYPTPIRTTGHGMVMVSGMISMTASPYILHSGVSDTFQYWTMLGLLIMVVLFVVSLPETLGLPLPQTFSEAENVGYNRPFTKWIHHWNKHKYPPKSASQTPARDAVLQEELLHMQASSKEIE